MEPKEAFTMSQYMYLDTDQALEDLMALNQGEQEQVRTYMIKFEKFKKFLKDLVNVNKLKAIFRSKLVLVLGNILCSYL